MNEFTCELWENDQYVILSPDGIPIGPLSDNDEDLEIVAQWLNRANQDLRKHYEQ